MAANRSLLMSGIVVASMLAACARGVTTTQVTPREERSTPVASPAAGDRQQAPTALSPQDANPAPRAQGPRIVAEALPAVELMDGADLLRVQVQRRPGKYPLVRREEVLGRGDLAGKVVQVREMVADHFLVSLAAGRDARAVAAAIGGEVRHQIPGSTLALIAFPYTAHTDYALYRQRLAAQLGVRVAEPDYLVGAIGTPDDSAFANLWGMNNTGQTGGTPDADIDAPEAWNISTGSKNVLVGVIDTGIDRNHVDLAANMWSNPGETGLDSQGNPKASNGIDDDGNGYTDDWRGWDFVNNDNDPTDDHYHGTHCAGTIGGAGNNGQGVAGVCWSVSMVGLKFLSSSGSGAISDAVAAQLYANSINCDLTSNSWGGGGYSQAMKDAIDAASAQGHLFVAAAGNNSSNNDTTANYPSNYDSPAVIAVAATTSTDGLASFSNYGAATVHLGAPGEGIYSCQPGNLYQNLSGTSMATPHVAGACALLKSANPQMTGPQIKSALLAHVDQVSALNGKTTTGGRLNLHKALLAVSGPVIAQTAQTVTEVGNGDGLLNPGESVDIAITLANQGSQGTTNVVGVLGSSNPSVQILQGTAAYGDLASGQTSSGSTYRVAIAAGSTTPQTLALTLTVTGAQGGPWTFPVTLSSVTSASLHGIVQRAGNGLPVAGATVAWTGPVPGSLVVNATGQFAKVVPAGSYQVTASATGLKTSLPVAVTLPNAANLILSLGAPSMSVTPTTVSLTSAMPSAVVQVANAGDAALAWQSVISAGAVQSSGLWHASSYRTATGTGTSWYYGNEATRTYETGATNSGALVFPVVAVPSAQPTLTFASWRQTEGGSIYDRSEVQVSTDGGLSWSSLLSATTTSAVPRDGTQVPWVGATAWTGVFQELDTTASWHAVSVNLSSYAGQTVALRFWFDTVDGIANTFEGWYVDDVAMSGVPMDAWLTVSASQGTVPAGSSSSVTVSANLQAAPAGTSNGSIVFSGDVPGGAATTVAVTLSNTSKVGPQISVSPASLALSAPLGTSTSGSITVSNTGDAALAITTSTAGGGSVIPAGLWHLTTYRTLGGSPVWWYGDETKKTYDTGAANSGALTFAGVAIPAGTPALTWQHWRQTEGTSTSYDKSLVQVSTNGGSTWTTLTQVVDNDALWHAGTTSLASYAGQTVSLRFFFDTVDSIGNTYEGWYVGDIRVAGQVIGQSWLSVSPATATVAPGTSTTITAQAAVAGLGVGTYSGQIQVASNASTGTVTVPVTCQVTASANITIGAQTMTDVGSAPYVGDADGFAEPGETVRWNVPLTNPGTEAATNVVMTASSTSTWVTFPAGPIALGTIPGQSSIAGALPVAIAAGCPANEVIPVAVQVAYSQGSKTASGSFTVLLRYRISGTVTEAGTGLSGVTVTAGGITTTTSALGTYQITGLVAGTYTVQFSKTNYVAATVSKVLPPDGVINLAMGTRNLVVSPSTIMPILSRGQSTVQNLQLQAAGTLASSWSVSSKPTWMTISPTTGTIEAGATQTVPVAIQTGALGNGTYSGSVVLATNASIGGATRSVSATLTIRSATAPTAAALSVTTPELTPVSFDLPAADADGDPLTYTVLSQPAHGTLSVTAAGRATYTPTSGWYGADSFTWRVSDGYDLSPTATVSLTVTHTNQPPVAGTTTVNLFEDGSAVVTLTGTDPEGDSLTCEVISAPAFGTWTASEDGWSGVYTPAPNWFGTDTLTFRVHDGLLSSQDGVVTLMVAPVNDAPTWTPGVSQTIDSDRGAASLVDWATGISVGPGESATQVMSFLVTNDRPDLFLVQPALSATGSLTWTPVAGAVGDATLTIIGQDSGGTAFGGIDQTPPVVRSLALRTYADADLARSGTAGVSILAGATVATEAVGTVPLTLTRSGPVAEDLVVSLQQSGSAVADQDVQSLPATVTIPAGQSSVLVPLVVLDDALAENAETVIVSVVAGQGYAPENSARSVTVTINDDEPVVVSMGIVDGIMGEPADAGVFRVTRTGSLEAALVVNLAWGGTSDAQDVVARPTSVTIPVNNLSANFTVTPVDDAIAEEAETVTCRIIAGVGYAVGTAAATITLQDNEPEEIAVEASTPMAAEPGVPGLFRIYRRGSTTIARTLSYTMSGTAVPGSDYPSLLGTVSLGSKVGSVTVSLTPSNDSTVEGSESATMTLAAVNGVPVVAPSATITILDNDGSSLPTVSLVITDGTADEGGGTGAVTITRTGSTTASLAVALLPITGSAASGADYAAIGSSVVIPAGKASATVVVQPLDDLVAEGNETVTVGLAPDPAYFVSISRSGTVTIADNEAVVLTLALSDSKAMEPGSDTGRFTITRNGPVTSALTVPVALAGTAQAGVDYQALPASIIIPVGAATANVVVKALDDGLREPDETVTLRILPSPAYTVAGAPAATVVIGDDEAPQVEALAVDPQATENGDKAVIRINRLGSRAAALTVPLAWSGTAGNGTDVNALPASVTIPANAGWADVTITPRQDTTAETAETIQCTVLAGAGYTVGASAMAEAVLTDDEAGKVSVLASVVDADEWDPASREVVILRSGSCAVGITVSYTVSGTARVAEQEGPRSVYLPPGVDRAVLRISPHPDDRGEGTETIIITLQPGVEYSLGSQTVTTVNLNEAPVGGG